jgi:glycosyltransferase involved in cell wall biosynthesis
MRGGEKCLEILCELYPDADLFTLLYRKDQLSKTIEGMKIKTSFIQNLPMASKYYRYYLPLFPAAIERFNLKGYDLVLSTSHCVAKGILPMPDALHISYCFTPMRYIWDMQFEYFKTSGLGSQGGFRGFSISLLTNYLRLWDVASSPRVDFFIAISKYVQKRIKKFYGRESEVLYPPVNCDFFCPSAPATKEGDYFLIVTAMAPYKRVDLAIEAFNGLGKPLLIVGDGPELKGLKKRAKKNIEFLGWRNDGEVRDYYRGCKAFIFPGKEDFGITPLEAQACGKPVIAYGEGGVLETVAPFPQEKATGILFHPQTAESLIEAIELFERNRDRFDPQDMRRNALSFDQTIFREKILSFVEEKYQAFQSSLRSRG